MVSGTDEHGTPVMVTADREGRSPRETADHYNALIRNDLRNLGLSYDLFTRTTTRNHERVTRDVFRALFDNGYIIERTALGAFSDARGDQCDNCGNLLDPIDLIEPRSKIDGATPEFRETSHLFLDLPAF